jgi:transcriptional regulator with XRE-family HTH domain
METRIGPAQPVVFLREWREKMGLTQEELAERMGTTKATVSRKETGGRGIKLEYLAEVAAALRIETRDLLRHPDRPTADDLMRDATPEEQRRIRGVIEALRKSA